ncbi:hypothetical protein NDU88_012090 [Pleurodeles waltl]|uniref:Uncharacterized protein n=1 Tax=Pleurodeles waltl TaxID=8319 RepID=A0AAV7QZ55_PLEWA|nr:hypothetical protein NDU88_012090 [Pleurodeles waltl]
MPWYSPGPGTRLSHSGPLTVMQLSVPGLLRFDLQCTRPLLLPFPRGEAESPRISTDRSETRDYPSLQPTLGKLDSPIWDTAHHVVPLPNPLKLVTALGPVLLTPLSGHQGESRMLFFCGGLFWSLAWGAASAPTAHMPLHQHYTTWGLALTPLHSLGAVLLVVGAPKAILKFLVASHSSSLFGRLSRFC